MTRYGSPEQNDTALKDARAATHCEVLCGAFGRDKTLGSANGTDCSLTGTAGVDTACLFCLTLYLCHGAAGWWLGAHMG